MTAKMDALQVVGRGKAEFVRTSFPELVAGRIILLICFRSNHPFFIIQQCYQLEK